MGGMVSGPSPYHASDAPTPSPGSPQIPDLSGDRGYEGARGAVNAQIAGDRVPWGGTIGLAVPRLTLRGWPPCHGPRVVIGTPPIGRSCLPIRCVTITLCYRSACAVAAILVDSQFAGKKVVTIQVGRLVHDGRFRDDRDHIRSTDSWQRRDRKRRSTRLGHSLPSRGGGRARLNEMC